MRTIQTTHRHKGLPIVLTIEHCNAEDGRTSSIGLWEVRARIDLPSGAQGSIPWGDEDRVRRSFAYRLAADMLDAGWNDLTVENHRKGKERWTTISIIVADDTAKVACRQDLQTATKGSRE